jgi:hypothetical protein
MKLSELFLTDEDQVKKAEGKLKGLVRSMEDGDAPEIRNAAYTIEGPAWGDLEKLGFAYRDRQDAGHMSYDERWVLDPKAPGPITLLTRYAKGTPGGGMERGVRKNVMQPGEATDWITVDVS